MNENNYVVIMAGGIGSRFWPFSRTNHPKQFHDVLGTGKTLLQQTAERFDKICPKENIYVVTNKIYTNLVKEQLPFISDSQILKEPIGRNTAPCIAYATYKIFQKNNKANILVAPSDHIVLKENEFEHDINQALEHTKAQNILVTLGIKPSRPDTGYGYIQYLETSESSFYKVKTFTEKPALEMAMQFLLSGDFVWNAGIFIANAQTLIQEFNNHLPEMAEVFLSGNESYFTEKEESFILKAYSQCKNISMDYGIMEKANNVFVMLSDFGWSDLGTWKSLYENSDKDQYGNVKSGDLLVYDSKNCIIKTPSDKLVVIEGLENYIVAEYENVLMICRINQEQRVRQFVADVKSMKDEKFV
ncbi:MAG: mannose-1-phosphate guanylyltransferase [Cytophagales bacterium]|nr:MAG: mannose-1-phosphate guanylyltransferase [Cytophagales bacterium]